MATDCHEPVTPKGGSLLRGVRAPLNILDWSN